MTFTDDYVDVDGIRTHYLMAGEGRPVVLLHGGEFGGAAELSWEHTIPALSEHYRVIAPDWLGFGYTDKVHDFVSGQQRRLEHMRRFLEVLKIGPAAFIGNSMGGLLLAKAIALPQPLWAAEALVVVSAGGATPNNESRRVLLDYDCSKESMRRVLSVLFYDPSFAADEVYLKRRYDMSIVPGAWECAAAARLKSPVAPARSDFGAPDSTAWDLIKVPTLIVAGREDSLKEPDYSAGLVEQLPDGRRIVYDACGHAPNIEVHEQFNSDVLAFLSETYPAA
jgi:pimeloyl-ACP methyl ester carboxylesterase